MKVVCIGAGPAGLYFSILTKLRHPDAEVAVLERNPAGVTYGWGVTFSDDVLDSMHAADPVSAERIRRGPASWSDQLVRLGDKPTAHLGGYGFAIGRHRLLELLADRAEQLGVQIHYDCPVDGDALDGQPGLPGGAAPLPVELPAADLVVAADGANSRLRQRYADQFGTETRYGRNHYIWLGTSKVFTEFQYVFEHTEAGWIWFYAYPFDGQTTTFIAECGPDTWRGLGFDRLDRRGCLDALQRIFARHLDGNKLRAQGAGAREDGAQGNGPQSTGPQSTGAQGGDAAPWLNFAWVTNRAWYRDNLVLLGDAAHTTHFSIGNGTKLAIDDAIELDRQLATRPAVAEALEAYQRERVEAVGNRQLTARHSARWFEEVDQLTGLGPTRFSFALRTRGEQPRPEPAGIGWMLHRATQLSFGRWARGQLSSAKRRQRARED